MIHHYELELGLPHTSARGFSEPHLMMYAGHFQWTSIARAVRVPLSALRTRDGGEVYATFYFIEVSIPDDAPLESFGLDERLRFAVSLRAFKNLAVEGKIVFDRSAAVAADAWSAPAAMTIAAAHPWVHFGNIFITPVQGNSRLRVAPPANADFSHLPVLPNSENPYHITKEAATTGRLQLIDDRWTGDPPVEVRYRIDPDRDTNGAGLVYFANYLSFLELAERRTLDAMSTAGWPAVDLASRSLRRRRVAYYGNVDVNEEIVIRVRAFTNREAPDRIGFRYTVHRDRDGVLICLSEAIKTLPPRQ